MSVVNQFIKKMGRNMGVEIDRVRPYRHPVPQLLHLCEQSDCQTLLDIGANKGQFAREVQEAGFAGRIYSFEPQKEAHAALVENAAQAPRWEAARRMCIGDVDGVAELNLSANSVSSSILPVLDASVSAQADTAYVGVEKVPMRRLDSWVQEELAGEAGLIAVKVDVQGFESGVLAGAEKILDRIIAFELEMSLTPLYDGAPSFVELYSQMEELGYACMGIYPGFTNVKTYQMLQVDGLFAKEL